jgi:transposase-like protein
MEPYMTVNLTDPIFTDEETARRHFEASRWPNGPECPHCGVVGQATELKGKSTRPGLYNCRACDEPFTATIGTIFERSHIPMHKWLLAMHLMSASKKGISAHQLWRMLGFGSYRTAWFMAHRIRESMRELHPEKAPPMGSKGKPVEADETYVGGKDKNKHRNKRQHVTGAPGKEAVFALVERGGKVRSHHVPVVNAKTLRPILEAQLDKNAYLMTDGAMVYYAAAHDYKNRQIVNHEAGEYVRGDAHTNTVESYFATLKRGIIGTYHHVSQQHLKRYLAEFDFRYNERASLEVTDTARAAKALLGVVGKRVTYQETNRKGA